MKPYGREKNLKGGSGWKIDHRIRSGGRKIGNWWEETCDLLTRSRMKQDWFKDQDYPVPQAQEPVLESIDHLFN